MESSDRVLEALKERDLGIYVMFKTANPSSFDVEDFVRMYPDPDRMFGDRYHRTKSYMKVISIHFYNEFRWLRSKFIDGVIEDANKSFQLVEKKLSQYCEATDRSDTRIFLKEHRPRLKMPEHDIDLFLDECHFQEHYVSIMALVEEQREVAAQVPPSDLESCVGCGRGDVMPHHMLACARGDAFCSGCVRKATEDAISAGRSIVPCMHVWCASAFEPSTLARAVARRTLRRLGVAACPHCGTEARLTDAQTILRCGECSRASCRECKHVLALHEVQELDVMNWDICLKCIQ